MKIQMEVTQKMKLYNIYRLCKKYIGSIADIEKNHLAKAEIM